MSEREVIGEGHYLRLVREGRWEFVERLNIAGIVGIIAVTDSAKLLLTEQYRPAVAANVLALPAGLAEIDADGKHEPLAQAAARELLEETGYKAARMEYLFSGPPSPGLSDEKIALFRAHGAVKVGTGGGDAGENIFVHAVALASIDEWLRRKGGEGWLIDPKIYTALYLIGKFEKSRSAK